MKPTERLINVIQPNKPLYAAYFNEETKTISTDPVFAMACWEITQTHGDEAFTALQMRPILLVGAELDEEDGTTGNYLGLSEKAEIALRDWPGLIK